MNLMLYIEKNTIQKPISSYTMRSFQLIMLHECSGQITDDCGKQIVILQFFTDAIL